MTPSLRTIVLPFFAVVAAGLVPVALVAFLTIPFNLGGHPAKRVRPTCQPAST
jgi:hypothetical protein